MAGFAFQSLANTGTGGLPKPGQLPKPPAPPKPPGFRIGGALLKAGGVSKPSVGTAGSSLMNLAGKLSQKQPGATQPAPAAAAAPSGAADQPSPLDSTYDQNVNDFLFKTNNSINSDQAKIAAANIAYQNALGQLAYQQPRDALALEQKANANGGLFSSVYDQNQANLQHAYSLKQAAAQSSHDNSVNSLTAAIAALQGEIPLYEASQAEAAAQRAAQLAQNNPALGAPPPAAAAPVASSGGGGGKGKGKATGPGSALLNLAGNLSKGRKR